MRVTKAGPKSEMQATDGRYIYSRERRPGEAASKHLCYAVATGEYRNPQAGEFYISGAFPEAYFTRVALDTPYYIARAVQVKKTVSYTIEAEEGRFYALDRETP